jgi:chromosome segregation ATPase
LNEESRGIKQDIDAVNAAIEQVRARNLELARQAEDIRVRNEQNSEAGQVARYKEILAERNDRIRSQGEALEAVKARVRSLENRVSVKGLRVQGLEVERKAQDVDVKVRDEAAVAALRQEVARAREQVSLGQRQRRVLREKTAELNGIENPYVAQIKQTMASNAELKDRVAAFAERRERLSAQLQDLTARRTSVESDKNVKRAVSLLSDRALLERELKDNSVILEQLRQEGAPAVDAAGDLRAADIDKLKAQNAEIEDLLTNLRENVALLEYKITTLERYKGRKGPGRK